MQLFVDVRTDYRTPYEFRSVRTVVADRDVQPVVRELSADAELLSGARAAELGGLEPGRITVMVELLHPARGVVARRRLVVTLGGDTLVSVPITRSCAEVDCPPPGEPDRTECLGGQCVPPECDVEEADSCGPAQCTSDADCTAEADCAKGLCLVGRCFEMADDSQCGPDRYCDLQRGCLDRPDGGADAGGPILDAGVDAAPPCDPAACDDGNPCTLERCEGGHCINDPDEGAACDDGTFCNGADTCDSTGACTIHDGDPCDPPTTCAEDTCVGCSDDGDCPDRVLGAWSECGRFSDRCDERGTQARTVTTFRCGEGRCVPREQPAETRDCLRDTDGTRCGSNGMECHDGECSCPGGSTETACNDGQDNDCDGLVDCGEDPDCDGRPVSSPDPTVGSCPCSPGGRSRACDATIPCDTCFFDGSEFRWCRKVNGTWQWEAPVRADDIYACGDRSCEIVCCNTGRGSAVHHMCTDAGSWTAASCSQWQARCGGPVEHCCD